MTLGAFLPWITFYAGLQKITGFSGANGKALVAAGLALCVMAVLQWKAPSQTLRLAAALLGSLVVAAAVVLLVRANNMLHLQSMMMMVPGISYGLYVVMGGGAAVVVGQAALNSKAR